MRESEEEAASNNLRKRRSERVPCSAIKFFPLLYSSSFFDTSTYGVLDYKLLESFAKLKKNQEKVFVEKIN